MERTISLSDQEIYVIISALKEQNQIYDFQLSNDSALTDFGKDYINICKKENEEIVYKLFELSGKRRPYSEYIKMMKNKWIGKEVFFEGQKYAVVDVDYNGGLLINKKAEYTDTTAVDETMVEIA